MLSEGNVSSFFLPSFLSFFFFWEWVDTQTTEESCLIFAFEKEDACPSAETTPHHVSL